MMKKLFHSKIILFSFLFLTIISLTINLVALRVDKWSVVEEEKTITSAYVFFLYLHSWFDTEHLEDNEFLFGDVIDFCYVYIIKRKPVDLEIKPDKIIFISPSKKIYEINFTNGDNYFTAGKFTQSKEDALVILNESGLWSINILFDNKTPLSLISNVDFEVFTNNSEIHIFYGLNINIYTNLEYQELRAAKAMEESTKASEESKNWAIYSTIALSIAAIIAAITLCHNYRTKVREVREECKFKVSEHLLNILFLIKSTKEFLDHLKSNNYQYTVDSEDSNKYQNIKNRYHELREKLAIGAVYASSFPESKKLFRRINEIFLEVTSFNESSLEKLSSSTVTKKYINNAVRDLNRIDKLIREFLIFSKI